MVVVVVVIAAVVVCAIIIGVAVVNVIVHATVCDVVVHIVVVISGDVGGVVSSVLRLSVLSLSRFYDVVLSDIIVFYVAGVCVIHIVGVGVTIACC